ncbi:hypothetical protein GE061_009746 [Apolygus lucorum]|uniref:Group XV phospholipase A2 n=1 Tax=Apolygus lucorum TaxID=248454 RepID=A0A8S9Y343_APOLU|nr:hypothetical protein GE061_009746 [Apolygus lucorum]
MYRLGKFTTVEPTYFLWCWELSTKDISCLGIRSYSRTRPCEGRYPNMHPVIFFAVYSCTMIAISASNYPPVILVPGFGGSQLQTKVGPPPSFNSLRFCDYIQWIAAHVYHNTFFDVYLKVFLLLFKPMDKCTVSALRLNYNNVTRKTTDSPQIQTRVKGFGDPYWIEWLEYTYGADWIAPLFGLNDAYYKLIAQALLKLGYKRNVSLRGAPYDFRKGPNELQVYFEKLKDLVEYTYKINGNKRVVFVTHSYGGTLSVSFLRAQTQKWKDKYMKSMISLAGVLGGTATPLKGYTRGNWITESPEYVYRDVKVLARSFPSIAYLMPTKELWGNEVLVSRPQKNYSLSNLKELYDDLNDPIGWEMWKDQQPYVSLEPPRVEFHCVYGTTDKDTTTEGLIYEHEYQFPDEPRIKAGPGDGTVNLRSLEYCKKWKQQQNQAVYVEHFHNVDHLGIVTNKETVDYITKVLQGYANKIET